MQRQGRRDTISGMAGKNGQKSMKKRAGKASPDQERTPARIPRRLRVREITSKSALTSSKIPGIEYSLNPYVGCMHGCRYCYVRLMQRFFGHAQEEWGSFVDIKSNVTQLLLRELARKKKGVVMLSSSCDPYQAPEKKLGITRSCLELLCDARFPVRVLTKSKLVVRDIDLFKEIDELRIGISITTDNDQVRKVMEPRASSIFERIAALKTLDRAGLDPYVFIGPILPMNARDLALSLDPTVSSVYFDSMNYQNLTKGIIKNRNWENILDPAYADQVIDTFRGILGEERVAVVGK